MPEPHWAHAEYAPIDYQDIVYYSAPKQKKKLGSMDEVDQYCVSRVLEYAPDRARIHWYGDPGITYGVTPLSTFERDGRYCREFHTAAQIDGRNERVYGIACRMPDGVWQVMS